MNDIIHPPSKPHRVKCVCGAEPKLFMRDKRIQLLAETVRSWGYVQGRQESNAEIIGRALHDLQAKHGGAAAMTATPRLDLIPLGWAPGGYQCRCLQCGALHEADKRAWRCIPCAEKTRDYVVSPELKGSNL